MPEFQYHVPWLAAVSHYRFAAVAAWLLCGACYALALQGPFFFDDIPNLIDNRLLQIDGWAFDDWRGAIISNNSGLFHRPVAMASFAMNYAVGGDFVPWLFKATNLVIHLLARIIHMGQSQAGSSKYEEAPWRHSVPCWITPFLKGQICLATSVSFLKIGDFSLFS